MTMSRPTSQAAESSEPSARIVFREQGHERLGRLVDSLRRAVDRRPALLAAAISGLVAEGRRFAETSEGAPVAAYLAESDLVKRGIVLWQALGIDRMVTDVSGRALPSVVLRELAGLIAGAIRSPGFHDLLVRFRRTLALAG